VTQPGRAPAMRSACSRRGSGDPLTASLSRLRVALFGGLVTTVEKVEALLREEGLVEVRALPGPATSLTAIVAARRRL
jgi:hypothetical protein